MSTDQADPTSTLAGIAARIPEPATWARFANAVEDATNAFTAFGVAYQNAVESELARLREVRVRQRGDSEERAARFNAFRAAVRTRDSA